MSKDPYRYFRVEARELHEQLAAGVLDLEKGRDPAAAVAKLLRVAHTLKGAARVVKHPSIADLAHAIEDALEPLRDGAQPATRAHVDALLTLVDGIAEGLRAVDAPAAAPAAPSPAAAATPTPAAAPSAAPLAIGVDQPSLRADAADLEALLAGLAEAHAEVARVRDALGPFDRLRGAVRMLGEQLASPRGLASPGAPVRLGALAEELRGTIASLERDLGARVDRAERELGESREAAERLRLMPADRLFLSLERTARDAAAAVDKRVTFEGTGGDVRLEGDVLAAAGAALVQAVRNAVAHGVETPSARAAAGKDPTGRVTVTVSRRGSRVSFACVDDGAGVDLEAVRAKAEQRGVPAAEARALTRDGLLALLLRGGLSTAGAVTGLAGRGVGLDLVRATAERLGGEAAVRSEPGRGTTVELTVPVRASSLDALLVDAGGQTVAIPLAATRRTARVTEADLTRGPDGASVVFDGAVVPFAPLERVLWRAAAGPTARAWPAVVVETGAGPVALGVERLVGVEGVILRPLPELAPAHAAVLGVWLDAAGAPRLVLDPAGLSSARGAAVEVVASAARPTVLVIDDSLTTRMLEQSILEAAGYEVEVAASGEEGLAKAREGRYGLFLVDVEMPGMDGFTFIERTKTDPSLRGVPAILVTSRASPEDRARGVAAGAVGHIEKSEFNQVDLLARIRGLIG